MEINAELINSILRQYESYMESEIPDNIKLDEERKAFVQGYLCSVMQQENIQRTDGSAIRSQIIQTRSKYCEPILELLASEGELYHGDLAEKLNLSPSGLNAIIKKMQETEIPIINTTQIGKYKIYSLPDDVREYMLKKGNVHIQEQPEEEDAHKTGEDMKRPDIFLCLQDFIELAGQDWQKCLNKLFRGAIEDISAEVRERFKTFVDALSLSYTEDVESVVELKKDILKNPMLEQLLDNYMKNYDLRKEIERRKDAGELTLSDKRIIGNML